MQDTDKNRIMRRIVISLFFAVLCALGDLLAQICYTVDYSKVVADNSQFWKACGYDFFFKIVPEPEGQVFLDRAQKHNSVRYYRTHNTFNDTSAGDKKAEGSICGRVLKVDSAGNYVYDFSVVNRTFREYVKRGMKPIVEFDFYPEVLAPSKSQGVNQNDELFISVEGAPRDWDRWEELLNKFMQNLIAEFGKEELKTWYFEVWNEPDGWRQQAHPNFFRLYDVFAHVVKSYDKEFKVGGPGCYNLHFMREFLNHIQYGKNYVTGEIGAPIDFVSHHIYGLSGSWLPSISGGPIIYPTVQKFTMEMLWMQRLLKKYPAVKDAEIHINEWGLCSHGDTKFATKYPELEYRNSEYSALFMVKLVDCLMAIEDNFKFKTDLLLYWGAWYNASMGPIFWGSRDLMTSGCVPKPILTAYEMLARLGEQRLQIVGTPAGGTYGLIATKGDKQCQLLLYDFNETESDFERTTPVTLTIDNLDWSGATVKVAECWMTRDRHNTYRKWLRMGRPEKSDEVVDTLMKEAELTVDKSYARGLKDGKSTLNIDLPAHSMCLITLSEE